MIRISVEDYEALLKADAENGKLRAELAALKAASPSAGAGRSPAGWQPMDSAPKGGILVLLTGQNGVVLTGFYRDDRWQTEYGNHTIYDATHWMPLPSPPGRAGECRASPSVSVEPPYVSGCNNCGGVNGAHLPGCEYVALLERRAVSGELTFQRFEPAQIYGDAEMRPSEDGDWVRLTDVEPLLQLVAHHCELAAMLVRPPVVMCACEHWLTCEHPWPSPVEDQPAPAEEQT